MRSILRLLPAVLLWACAQQPTEPETGFGPRATPSAAPRTAGVDADLDGVTVAAGDCDDTDPAIHPRRAEIPGNDIDDDCNAATLDSPVPGALSAATFDAGYSHGDLIVDGTTYNGLRFQTDNDLGMFYDDSMGRGGSGCLYDNAEFPGDLLWFTVTRSDFGDFGFDSVWIGATAGNRSLTVRGFLDGEQVEVAEDVDVSFDGAHQFGWSRVDEVRFEAETDLFSCFDDFTYAGYGLSAPDQVDPTEGEAPADGESRDDDAAAPDAPAEPVDGDPGSDDTVDPFVTADFDSGHSRGDLIVDGTTYDGLRFETDRDRGMFYHDSMGRGGSGCLYDNAEFPGDLLWFTVTRSDFGDFGFDSVWIGATAGNRNLTVRGFLDGEQVEVAEDVDVSFDGSHQFGWNRVDEVRFEAETDLFSCFDDFTYASPGP